MAGFRLREGVGIELFLRRLTEATLEEIEKHYGPVTPEFKGRLERALKHVLHYEMEASPLCGLSTTCNPSEGLRARPWSRQAAAWGLVSQADPELERSTPKS
ncbi:MAG: hypothetical protein NZ930_02010 [Candidatus Bipolaricaulota bacterium]|nr:hypothetical protein [Candidatus Bipolaricaulota bacterium]MDW8030932.1 hypothetical protein [Candidatus Bipolaricaulota bacterium]